MFIQDLAPSELIEAPPAYRQRQAEIAAQATGPSSTPVHIEYTDEENATWAQAQARLEPIWAAHGAPALLAAKRTLALPTAHIPQLTDVSDRLARLTGFRYASVAGTVPGQDFFAALGNKTFSSTQFIRWSGDPSYTPEPDVLHEVGGHAVSLAHPLLAELHRLAGLASLATPSRLTEIAAVFWYSVEFGVLRTPTGPKAYGAGLLSSPGELRWFADNAEIRPLNIEAMIDMAYDISRYQPLLFGADSLDHVFDLVGSYYCRLITAKESVCLT